MKQLGHLIFLIVMLAAGYLLTSPVPEPLAAVFFGVGLISLAMVGRQTLS